MIYIVMHVLLFASDIWWSTMWQWYTWRWRSVRLWLSIGECLSVCPSVCLSALVFINVCGRKEYLYSRNRILYLVLHLLLLFNRHVMIHAVTLTLVSWLLVRRAPTERVAVLIVRWGMYQNIRIVIKNVCLWLNWGKVIMFLLPINLYCACFTSMHESMRYKV